MSKNFYINLEKIKHFLYIISILILLGLSAIVFVQSVSNFTLLDHLEDIMRPRSLSLTLIFGAALFIALFLLIGKLLSKLSSKNQLFLTAGIAILGVIVQYFLLFHIQAVLRYDHLRVFDGGLEILNTGHLSLTANDGYYGLYPFNISIAAFNSIILRIVKLFGIAEKYYLLSLQCVYLFLIVLGVFFSRKIVRILYSIKHATLFALLAVTNPMLYVCAMGCYTTTLMLPLLMGTMFLFILFRKEQDFRKKLFWGFLAGAALAFGSRLRATVFISGIALVIYLIIRKKSESSIRHTFKQASILICTVLLGALLSFGGFTAYQNTFITEDYSDTQMPVIYYLMFAMNPGSKGSYNEDDFAMISQYETLEEKNEASIQVIKERLKNYGVSGTLSLAKEKLKKTWSDGIEDYREFLTTSRNYGKLHSYIAGEHSDFFALYAHIYNVAILALLCVAVVYALRKKCDSACYFILLTLLGGMVFHILWEAFYYYSFGFSMLLLIPASESIGNLSEKRYSPHTAGGIGIVAFAGLFLFLMPAIKELAAIEFKHNDYAVVQDMSLGECKPLYKGDVITQTFIADRPFNHIGVKAYNDAGAANESIYRMELLSADGNVLSHRDFIGAEAENGGYCYLKFDDIVPNGKETYLIQLTPLHTTETSVLMFGYYNTHQYDIYSDGIMTGLNSDARTDLAFTVFQRITSGYFH